MEEVLDLTSREERNESIIIVLNLTWPLVNSIGSRCRENNSNCYGRLFIFIFLMPLLTRPMGQQILFFNPGPKN